MNRVKWKGSGDPLGLVMKSQSPQVGPDSARSVLASSLSFCYSNMATQGGEGSPSSPFNWLQPLFALQRGWTVDSS